MDDLEEQSLFVGFLILLQSPEPSARPGGAVEKLTGYPGIGEIVPCIILD